MYVFVCWHKKSFNLICKKVILELFELKRVMNIVLEYTPG